MTEIHALVWAHPLAHLATGCHIFGTGEAKNFKFGVRIDLGKSHLMHDEMSPKGAWLGAQRIFFFKF